jgi:hypothetical protein
MYEMTEPECAHTCNPPRSCCDSMYCEIAREYAKDEFGVDLTAVSDGPLPYMGPSGCVVAPHLRPLCTMHTCQINSFGFKTGDMEWTEKYFKLRAEVDRVFDGGR